MKDAKQVTKIDEKPSNILAEYYDILTCPSCFYVRWMWILGFPIGIYGSYWINTILYWLFISYGLAQEDYGIFAVISGFTGLIVSCCCNCFWGIGYFGKKNTYLAYGQESYMLISNLLVISPEVIVSDKRFTKIND